MTADQYSAYHSIHDNFHLMSTWIDPDYKYHLAVARMWAKMGLRLADSTVVPFNLNRYAKKILEYARFFKKTHKPLTDPHGISYGKSPVVFSETARQCFFRTRFVTNKKKYKT